MRQLYPWTGLAVLLLALAGCGESHESVVKHGIRTLDEIADVLATVQDRRSAEAAGPRLQELGQRWRANQRRADAMAKPSEEQRALLKKYRPEFETAFKRYLNEAARVQRVPGGMEALLALGDVKAAETAEQP